MVFEGFAPHFLSEEGFETIVSKPSVEGFKKITYYTTFIMVISNIFSSSKSPSVEGGTNISYTVFLVPSTKGFWSLSKGYGDPEEIVNL